MVGRVGAQLIATINGITGGALLGILSFNLGPGGLMSPAVSNTIGNVLTGTLGAGTCVDVTARVWARCCFVPALHVCDIDRQKARPLILRSGGG